MKRALRVLTAILAIAAPMLAVASPASASHGGDDGGGSDYPPNTAMLTTPTPTTTRGAHLTLIASGFVPGSRITFTISQGNQGDQGHDGDGRGHGHGRDHATTLGTQVADANGGATLNTRAPQDAGRYTVTASSRDGLSASLTLTVTASHDHCDRSPRPRDHDSSGHEQCGTNSGHGSDD